MKRNWINERAKAAKYARLITKRPELRLDLHRRQFDPISDLRRPITASQPPRLKTSDPRETAKEETSNG